MSQGKNVPEIGAQVWIEPGQANREIDRWFKILSDHHMSCARLFIMWNYIEVKPDKWDFTLYDQVFEAAAKYGIKIQATLTANHGPAHQDKGYWYHSQGGVILTQRDQLADAELYIRKVVEHYKSHLALENWWLQNEPGQHTSHDELAIQRFRVWLEEKYRTIDALNESWITDFISFDKIEYHQSWNGLSGFYSPQPYHDWNIFWRDHLTWFVEWIANQVRKYDNTHTIHVNPHAVFDILPKYNLPAWRSFLSSLGASIHPSWHFGMLERDQYALGVSAICEIIKGAIEPRPFWISELQGGNNIFSSMRPMYPNPEDIAQWVWTGIGSGAEKVIFWCLNARSTGNEAGEWSMLDYQGNPSERLLEASNIARIIENDKDFFLKAKPVIPAVYIIINPETMLVQARQEEFRDFAGRMSKAHIQSALAFFETLSELGIPTGIKQSDDFAWDMKNENPVVAILPNMTCIPKRLIQPLENFVRNGNKLIVSGLTGYFDEKENNIMQGDFPLKELFGGNIKEIKLTGEIFHYKLNGLDDSLPVHMWKTEILPVTGQVEGKSGGEAIALRNKYGKGEVFWIPSMIGLGAWLDDNAPLSKMLERELIQYNRSPFYFTEYTPGALMKVLGHENEFLIVLTNGKDQEIDVSVNGIDLKKVKIIYGNMNCILNERVHLDSRGTVVLKYKQE